MSIHTFVDKLECIIYHSFSRENFAHVNLTLLNGNQRDFLYDYAFDMHASQDTVYEHVGRPVINDVLKGFNGTCKRTFTRTPKNFLFRNIYSMQERSLPTDKQGLERLTRWVSLILWTISTQESSHERWPRCSTRWERTVCITIIIVN